METKVRPGRKARGLVAVNPANQKKTAKPVSINREAMGPNAAAWFYGLTAWERGEQVYNAWLAWKRGEGNA